MKESKGVGKWGGIHENWEMKLSGIEVSLFLSLCYL